MVTISNKVVAAPSSSSSSDLDSKRFQIVVLMALLEAMNNSQVSANNTAKNIESISSSLQALNKESAGVEFIQLGDNPSKEKINDVQLQNQNQAIIRENISNLMNSQKQQNEIETTHAKILINYVERDFTEDSSVNKNFEDMGDAIVKMTSR